MSDRTSMAEMCLESFLSSHIRNGNMPPQPEGVKLAISSSLLIIDCSIHDVQCASHMGPRKVYAGNGGLGREQYVGMEESAASAAASKIKTLRGDDGDMQ